MIKNIKKYTENIKMENKSKTLFISLENFFQKEANFQELVNSIENNNGVSLRLIDWLVTNYSKENNTSYRINGKNFIVHQSYKDMLKAYSKKLFDPFRRHERISIISNSKSKTETTVAQMAFFKWAIENKVLEYAKNNKKQIKNHMDKHTVHRKNNKISNLKLKRRELSKSTRLHKIDNIELKISFK